MTRPPEPIRDTSDAAAAALIWHPATWRSCQSERGASSAAGMTKNSKCDDSDEDPYDGMPKSFGT